MSGVPARAVVLGLLAVSAACGGRKKAEPSQSDAPDAQGTAAKATPAGPATPPAQPSAPPSATGSAPSSVTASVPGAQALVEIEPSPLRTSRDRSARAVEAFNRWATRHKLREDLPALVALGRPVSPDTDVTIQVDYVGGESPSGAIVTVVEDGLVDDSVRAEKIVFRFSRQRCVGCASGWSGWWLGSLDVSWRCQPGRGQQDFASELCR